MFEDMVKTYGFDLDEEEMYYKVIMGMILNVHSPFEVDRDFDFPKKDKLGGVVLKFVGGGACYFKLQNEMPSEEEVKEIFEVCQFLKDSFGEYVMARIMCQPHIEIRDLDVSYDETIDVCFVSVRMNDGDSVLEELCEKLNNNEGFTLMDHIQRMVLPFMGRKNRGKFKSKYSKFISLLLKHKNESPDKYKLTEDIFKDDDNHSLSVNRIF